MIADSLLQQSLNRVVYISFKLLTKITLGTCKCVANYPSELLYLHYSGVHIFTSR